MSIGEPPFWLVNLAPGEGSHDVGGGGPGGILALSAVDPHLGCRVEWLPGLQIADRKGFFRTPCHNETYTKAGVRVAGPAPRSMDTYLVTVRPNGWVWIDRGASRPGDEENALRAVPYPR